MSETLVDLRSDTVTRPTPAMLRAMAAAPTGDDGYGDDPTVRALERRVAALLGHEAAILMPSGTMANQIALRLLVAPGEELLCESTAHVVTSEGGAAAQYGGISTRTVACAGGLMSAAAAGPCVHGAEHRAVPTRAIAVEQTANRGGGRVHTLAALRGLRALATDRGLAMHCDGARIWNASAASGVPLHEYGVLFDTLSVCLSKGLGAPVGSLLVSTRLRVERARRLRRGAGGTMRQAGVLAAAGLVALEHRAHLAADHARARELAELLSGAADDLALHDVETNIVLADLRGGVRAEDVVAAARARGVLVQAVGPHRLRCVTHRDVDDHGIARAGAAVTTAIAALRRDSRTRSHGGTRCAD